jgi:hypothetical protein
MDKESKQFYSAFKNKSEIISDNWKEFINQEWVSYYGFEAIPIPSIIWRQEKILRTIDKKFPFQSVGLIRLPINYNYNWHKDTNRGCGINMLLNHEKSHTFFEDSITIEANKSNNEKYNFDEFGFPFIELKYEPNTFYAFNTQKLHCVYNFNKPRYLFTCEFAQDHNELSYEMLYEWMGQNNL